MKRVLFMAICISLVIASFCMAESSDTNARLMKAVKDGNIQAVKDSLTAGADVNTKDQDGWPVLIWASDKGYLEIVKLLLEKGAQVDVKTTDTGGTPLFLASFQGHTEIVKLLLEKGAQVDVKRTDTGGTPLYTASYNGHIKIVKLLLEKDAQVNVKTTDGFTPLYAASFQGHL